MSTEGASCGVEMRRCKEFLKTPAPPAGWSSAVEHYRALAPGEYDGKYAGGYEFDVPVIAMPKFLPWLYAKCESLGVTFETRALRDANEARAFASNRERTIVVNCAGLGARELVNDELVQPVRGQVVYLKQDCGYGLFDDDPNALAYLIPRADCTVLGGTAQVGDDSLDPNDADARDIVAKCKRLWPELDESKVIGTNVGLRPSRTVVRCERDATDAALIHAYGHGGAGVTLCRGTALDVLRIIGEA
jgi:D-amino-acid oxidase